MQKAQARTGRLSEQLSANGVILNLTFSLVIGVTVLWIIRRGSLAGGVTLILGIILVPVVAGFYEGLEFIGIITWNYDCRFLDHLNMKRPGGCGYAMPIPYGLIIAGTISLVWENIARRMGKEFRD